MKLKSLKIKNFKGIDDLEIDFTYPDSDRLLENIVFYGVNGSGKSSILEAIYLTLSLFSMNANKDLEEKFLSYFNLSSSEWIYNNNNKFSINITLSEGIDLSFICNQTGMIDWAFSPSNKNPFCHFTFLSSYRMLYPSLIQRAGDWSKIKEFEERTLFSKEQNIFPALGIQFENSYQTIKQYLVNLITDKKVGTLSEKHNRILESIKNAFKIFFPEKIFLEQLSRTEYYQDYRLMIQNEDQSIVDLDQLSSGERELIAFFTYLSVKALNSSILIIDEPELHLHPEWQSMILYGLRKLFPDTQIFLATHSREIHQTASDSELFELKKGES